MTSSCRPTPPPRPGWPAYFLGIAHAVAVRGDCKRRQVGAVLVTPNNRVLATGYNGVTAGQPGCLSGACPRALSGVPSGAPYDHGPGRCIAVHAEVSALTDARERSVETHGTTMYVSSRPCNGCVEAMLAAGVSKAIWSEPDRTGVHVLLLA